MNNTPAPRVTDAMVRAAQKAFQDRFWFRSYKAEKEIRAALEAAMEEAHA